MKTQVTVSIEDIEDLLDERLSGGDDEEDEGGDIKQFMQMMQQMTGKNPAAPLSPATPNPPIQITNAKTPPNPELVKMMLENFPQEYLDVIARIEKETLLSSIGEVWEVLNKKDA